MIEYYESIEGVLRISCKSTAPIFFYTRFMDGYSSLRFFCRASDGMGNIIFGTDNKTTSNQLQTPLSQDRLFSFQIMKVEIKSLLHLGVMLRN